MRSMALDAQGGPSAPEGKLVALVERVWAGLWSWGLATLVVMLSPGLAMWPLAHPDDRDYVIENDLDPDQRLAIIKTMLLLAAVVAVVYLGYHLLRVRRGGRGGLPESARRLNRYAFVIAAAPALSVLSHRGIEEKHEFITLVVIGIATGILSVFVYRVLGLRAPKRMPELLRWKWLPPLVALMLGLFYGLFASYLALLDHRNLGTHI